MISRGKRYLITTDSQFIAPDGQKYQAVFGTVEGIYDSESALGIKTNRNSTNWYVVIGGMVIAGCRIHYAIRTDRVETEPPVVEFRDGGRLCAGRGELPLIYITN